MPSRVLLFVVAVVAGALVVPASALALKTAQCPHARAFRCATLTVPIDRTGAVKGTVALKLAIQPGDKPVLIALAGGPGQGGVAFASSFAASLAPTLRRYRLVVIDQRGTGGSGVIDCPAVQKLRTFDPYTPQDIADCGDRVGPRRAFYGTVDSVADLDAVRTALGVPKIAVMGVSYGTYVAAQYARIHPEQTDRLILDSTVGPDGVDPLDMDTIARLPRVLRQQCAKGRCAGATTDPVADLTAVVQRLDGGGAVRGPVYDRRGIAHPVSVTDASELLGIVGAADLNPFQQALLPGAMAAARAGDTAPLVRLRRIANGPRTPLSDLSIGLNVVTSCDDARLAYSLADPFPVRDAASAAAAAAVPEAARAPFSAATVLDNSYDQDCSRWPAGVDGDPLPGPSTAPLPDVPTLILGGELDMRTPLENAYAVAALLPKATVVPVPGTGHDELDSDATGCAQRALDRFVRDVAIGDPCASRSNQVTVAPRPPGSLGGVRGLAGVPGVRGRIASAVVAGAGDATYMAAATYYAGYGERPTGGGLRGGSFAGRFPLSGGLSVRLDRLAYVPGVRATGTVLFEDSTITGTVRVDGPGRQDGTLRFGSDGRVTGEIGGRALRSRRVLSREATARAAASAAARAATATPPDPHGARPLR